MKISRTGIEGDWCYFYWWNWLDKKYRYWGHERAYYDGPHESFGLWFFNVSWRAPWTNFGPDD